MTVIQAYHYSSHSSSFARNQNYPTLFEGKGDSGMAFVSHGLGGAYGSQKGLSCFYLCLGPKNCLRVRFVVLFDASWLC